MSFDRGAQHFLEVVRFEDRLLLPADLPVVSTALNRYAVRAPFMKYASLYRIYVLRDRGAMPAPRKASVSVIVPSRNEAGNVAGPFRHTTVRSSCALFSKPAKAKATPCGWASPTPPATSS